MTVKVWFLVFLFYGQPMASGPHDRHTCTMMAHAYEQAHCWNPETQERLRPRKGSGLERR